MTVLPMEFLVSVCVTAWGVFMTVVCVCVCGCVCVSPVIYVEFSVDNKVHNAAFLLIKSTIEKAKTNKKTNKQTNKQKQRQKLFWIAVFVKHWKQDESYKNRIKLVFVHSVP